MYILLKLDTITSSQNFEKILGKILKKIWALQNCLVSLINNYSTVHLATNITDL